MESDKLMTVDALMKLAQKMAVAWHENQSSRAVAAYDDGEATKALRAAIVQYGREQREAAATSKQVEDCVPAPPFDPAAEPPWHRSDMGPAGRGSGEEPKHGND